MRKPWQPVLTLPATTCRGVPRGHSGHKE